MYIIQVVIVCNLFGMLVKTEYLRSINVQYCLNVQVRAADCVSDTTRDHPIAGFTSLPSKQNHLSAIAVQDELLNQLINSPRFYHPRDGQDVKSFSFLYKELLKGQSQSRPFLAKKEFWSNLFMSTIDADRSYLGWNERTADLYSR